MLTSTLRWLGISAVVVRTSGSAKLSNVPRGWGHDGACVRFGTLDRGGDEDERARRSTDERWQACVTQRRGSCWQRLASRLLSTPAGEHGRPASNRTFRA